MRWVRAIGFCAAVLGAFVFFGLSHALAEDSFNELPSYAQGEMDTSKVPAGFELFWREFQSAVIRGDRANIAMLSIFPFGAPCERAAVQLPDFITRFHKQMEIIVMVKDPRDSRISDYVEMSLFNLIVSSPLNHPEFHYYSKDRVTLNRLEFRHILSKWYFSCW